MQRLKISGADGTRPSYLLMGGKGLPKISASMEDNIGRRRLLAEGAIGAVHADMHAASKGSARKYFESHRWMHGAPVFSDARKMIEWLAENRKTGASLAYLACALAEGGKIADADREDFVRRAGAADYWENNSWMRRAPSFKSDSTPRRAIGWLKKNRPPGAPTIGTLMLVLWYGDRILESNLESWQFIAGAAEYPKKNPWIVAAPRFESEHRAIDWLVENKPGGSPGLGYLVTVLWYRRKIPEGQLKHWQAWAGAAEYALRRREVFLQETLDACALLDAGSSGSEDQFMRILKKKMDKSKFTRLNHDKLPEELRKPIGERHFREAFNIAWKIYLKDGIPLQWARKQPAVPSASSR